MLLSQLPFNAFTLSMQLCLAGIEYYKFRSYFKHIAAPVRLLSPFCRETDGGRNCHLGATDVRGKTVDGKVWRLIEILCRSPPSHRHANVPFAASEGLWICYYCTALQTDVPKCSITTRDTVQILSLTYRVVSPITAQLLIYLHTFASTVPGATCAQPVNDD